MSYLQFDVRRTPRYFHVKKLSYQHITNAKINGRLTSFLPPCFPCHHDSFFFFLLSCRSGRKSPLGCENKKMRRCRDVIGGRIEGEDITVIHFGWVDTCRLRIFGIICSENYFIIFIGTFYTSKRQIINYASIMSCNAMIYKFSQSFKCRLTGNV